MSEEPPPNTDPSLEPVLQAISKDWGPRLKENTSLVVVSEACLGECVYVVSECVSFPLSLTLFSLSLSLIHNIVKT